MLYNPNDHPVEAAVSAGGNVNEVRRVIVGDSTPLAGLLMRSERVHPGTPQDGTMALVVLADDVTWRCLRYFSNVRT